MTTRARIILLIIAVAIISVLLLDSYQRVNQPKSADEVGAIYALVMLPKDVPSITEQQLLQGIGDVLLVEPKAVHGNNMPAETPKLYLFNTLSSLAQYDVDKSGTIDAADPIFNQLELGTFYARSKRVVHHDLHQSGVRFITFNPAYLAKEAEDMYAHDPNLTAAIVTMTDGTTRAMKVLPVITNNVHALQAEQLNEGQNPEKAVEDR